MITEELVKDIYQCMHSKSYFAEKYFKVKLKDVFAPMENMSREETIAFIVWTMIFRYNQDIAIWSSNKKEVRKFQSEILEKYKTIPWPNSKIIRHTQRYIGLDNGNGIWSVDNLGHLKGLSIELLVLDRVDMTNVEWLPIVPTTNSIVIRIENDN